METDFVLLRESRRTPDSFVEVCERHAGDLGGWLRREVGADVAEDLLAETFARAWFHRRRFRDPGTGSAGPWLHGIARNLVREDRRHGVIETRALRRLGLSPAGERAAFVETGGHVAGEADYGDLEGLVAGLPVEQRDALELRVVEDLDYGQIGSRLSIATGTARTRVHRALKTLRALTERSEQ